jgi:2,5-dihydroxypyridine 5,6-dioxygenase
VIRWSEFAFLCEQELQLCGVREGETVVVLSQANDRLDYADAFVTAARRLGANAWNLRLGETASVLGGAGVWSVGLNPLTGNESALEALKSADLVIDLVFLMWSKEQLEIERAGTRILMVVEPKPLLARMFPTPDLRRRVETSQELLARASTLRVTSPSGTDVVYRLGTYPVMTEYGYTDTPGRWDTWPAGFLFTGGADDGVDGLVVAAPGDILVAPFKVYLREAIQFTIEAGQIVDIRGGFEADLVRDYIAGFDDPRAYGVSHIGWGLNEKARWSHLANAVEGAGQEARAFYGNVMFATGPNQELGGTNNTPAHIDIPMRDCSLYLDDEPILVDGEFTPRELQVAGARTGPRAEPAREPLASMERDIG